MVSAGWTMDGSYFLQQVDDIHHRVILPPLLLQWDDPVTIL